MRVEGTRKLIRQLEDLPDATKDHVRKAVRRNLDAGERVANTLAPDVTHETRGNIYSEVSNDGMGGEIRAIRSDAPREDKDRAYAVHWGRKSGVGSDGKNRGTTAGYEFMWRTRQYLKKRFKNSIRRAVRKAAKEVTNG